MTAGEVDAFAHIRRSHDPRFPHEVATIMPGEYFVSRTPIIVYTVLGSCISACIRDQLAGVGGMNHFMLPAPNGDARHDSWGESTRYGSYAMEMLINDILKRGGVRNRLEVKLFGGGRIYDGNLDVGARNIEWALDYVKREALTLSGSDVGNVFPRKVYYFTDSGRVLLKKIERLKNSTIQDREAAYAAQLRQPKPVAESDVTLF